YAFHVYNSTVRVALATRKLIGTQNSYYLLDIRQSLELLHVTRLVCLRYAYRTDNRSFGAKYWVNTITPVHDSLLNIVPLCLSGVCRHYHDHTFLVLNPIVPQSRHGCGK